MDIEVMGSETFGLGGFSLIKRFTIRNIREDGSRSERYPLDLVERPAGTDAVAILPYDRGKNGEVRVLLRRGLRPGLKLGRSSTPAFDGSKPGIDHVEVVAGIIESGEETLPGIFSRAAKEIHEETGLRVHPQQIRLLGAPFFLSPGLMAERIVLCQVEHDLVVQDLAMGDGTALEEGGEGLVLSLPEALHYCATGKIQDAKTEIALRRLKDSLQSGAV